MAPKTQGPIRGFLGRWIMRFEASGQVLTLFFQGTTAVSALSGVLAFSGFEWAVPFVMALGGIGVIAFAYVYVELGLYNRKNREKQERGNNFAKPQNFIDDAMIARGVLTAMNGRTLDDEERREIEQELEVAYREYRNGIPIEDQE